MNWLDQVVESIPEHSSNIAHLLKKTFDTIKLSEEEKNGLAFVAALSSGNGELAFEIEMSSLTKSSLRETLKGIVTEMSVRNKIQDYLDIYRTSTKLNVSWISRIHFDDSFTYSENTENALYCYAVSIAQSCKTNSEYFLSLLKNQPQIIDKLDDVVILVATVASINKITL